MKMEDISPKLNMQQSCMFNFEKASPLSSLKMPGGALHSNFFALSALSAVKKGR